MDVVENLRRLLVGQGMTLAELARESGVDLRTIRSLLAGHNVRPHSRTLSRLAAGLGVATDELFRGPSLSSGDDFNRRTNPVVDEVIAEQPRLFAGWTQAEFDELYSHFGEGGSLTKEGTRATVAAVNRKREVQRKVALLLETGEADMLIGFVELLYKRVAITSA